ncbi:hypothetical protein GCM10010178_89330 [Lentzea flava]|uniref:AraC-type transcription regulator ligand-binding domain-containing protein n=1 Tax=Lentzea flava TaxID=103732 RepID=A0ABQ2VG56_9PSEU|nr:cupin domain-containing protein [Lentzea flava]MCP2205272.1 Cupin [Lentzea flava]GGU85281.1 hypothetical protein GCM10010178_89330 [Lentzea flava]
MVDPLSEVLALLKPRSYITAGFDAGGDWALELDDLAGRIKCYAVVKGACWLTIEGSAPVPIPEGACFVLPTGRTAVIGSAAHVEPVRSSVVLDPDRSGKVVTYNGGGNVYLVGSRFEAGSPHIDLLLHNLPSLMVVRTSDDRARLRWSIELMMEEFREPRLGSALMAQQLAHMMLVQALRLYLAEPAGDDVGWFAALADPQVHAALAAMHANPRPLLDRPGPRHDRRHVAHHLRRTLPGPCRRDPDRLPDLVADDARRRTPPAQRRHHRPDRRLPGIRVRTRLQHRIQTHHGYAPATLRRIREAGQAC